MTQPPPSRQTRRVPRGGWLMIGFALGGFFDGILLHQLLQWHHLLSGVLDPGALRFQVMADGIFHLLMYVLAIAGMAMVLRARAAGRPSSRDVLRLLLVGFGAWHVVDALLSHWLLGIHRIRMDSAVPLAWDLAWLAIFGLLPLLVAWRMPRGDAGTPSQAMIAGTLLVTLTAGFGAALPTAPDGGTMVIFRAGLPAAERMRAVTAAGARLRWSDTGDTVWLLDGIGWGGMLRLYAGGAIAVGATPLLAGCLAATRPA